MHPEEEWMSFREFDEPRAATGLCLWLHNEQVHARAEGGTVYVPRNQFHRADWVMEHLPPTEEDLLALSAAAA